MTEARHLAEERMREVSLMSLDELLRFADEPLVAEIPAPSGRLYRMKTHSFWDMEPYESDLYTRVKVTGRGARAYQRYLGVESRGPEHEFVQTPEAVIDVAPTWKEVAGWLIGALVLLAFIAPWLVGIAFLVSRVL